MWEPPQPWNHVATSNVNGKKFILAGDGFVYSKSDSLRWVNHGTLEEFKAHAIAHWKPLQWMNPGEVWRKTYSYWKRSEALFKARQLVMQGITTKAKVGYESLPYRSAPTGKVKEWFVKVLVNNNPGEAWHEGMEHVAARHGRDAETKEEKLLFKGVEVAHKDSKLAARRLKMNGLSRPLRKNPLAVFTLGNPPQRVNAAVAGIIYNRCLEIRAEKTGYKKGLYRHPFNRNSGVQILALDNGDLLIHSTRKVRLWMPS